MKYYQDMKITLVLQLYEVSSKRNKKVNSRHGNRVIVRDYRCEVKSTFFEIVLVQKSRFFFAHSLGTNFLSIKCMP